MKRISEEPGELDLLGDRALRGELLGQAPLESLERSATASIASTLKGDATCRETSAEWEMSQVSMPSAEKTVESAGTRMALVPASLP